MNLKLLFFLALSYIATQQLVYAQEADSSALRNEIKERFQALDVSYFGTTQNCVAYDVYAFKYFNSWILTVIEDETVGTFITRPPRTKEKIHNGSMYYVQGTSFLTQFPTYYKKKRRRKTVNDLDLYGYYKLKHKGKKAMRGLLLIELPDLKEHKEPTFFLFKFFDGLFGKAAEKVEDNRIKTNLEDKIKSAEETANEQIDQVK